MNRTVITMFRQQAEGERTIESSNNIDLYGEGFSIDTTTITVAPVSMTVSASIIDTGDGVFCTISSNGSTYGTTLSSVTADGSGNWTLNVKAEKADNTVSVRNCIVRLTDDSDASVTIDIEIDQMVVAI